MTFCENFEAFLFDIDNFFRVKLEVLEGGLVKLPSVCHLK